MQERIVDGLPMAEKEMKVLLKKLKAQLGTGGAPKVNPSLLTSSE